MIAIQPVCNLEWRVVILAPTLRDAQLTRGIFARAGIDAYFCTGIEDALVALDAGAAAVVVPEEMASALVGWLRSQAPWSDLPVLVLARPGADSADVAQAMDILGNVTVIERPTRVTALVSATRAALRARDRQYQIRDYLNERRQSAELLSQRIDEMQTLLQTLPIGVFIAHDPECSSITGNPAATALLRMDADANLSKSAPVGERPESFRVCRDGQEIPPQQLPVQRAARGEHIRDEPVDQVFIDGTVIHTLVSASPLTDVDGRYRGAVGAIVDVTALRQTETALRDADRRKDEFLAILAHELRNPLAPIANAVEILRRLPDTLPAVHRVAAMMDRQVRHMVRLVDDLLEVSRITRGKIELRRELVDLASVIATAVESSRSMLDAGRHEFRTTLPAEPTLIRADPIRLAQVISNLLNNAARYTDVGGRIELIATVGKREAAIAIVDNGIGIPAGMLRRVFELFTQINRGSGKPTGGLGIGLTLVDRLVELHGGRVQAESAGEGKGSTFTVFLPLERLGGQRDPKSPPRSPVADLTSERILVADDNRDSADSLVQVLRLMGAETCVAYSGAEALAAIDRFRPNVALLDIGMPGMDGHELAREIRTRKAGVSLRLIALSGWGQETDIQRSAEAGFDHHFIKPVDVDVLTRLIRRYTSAAK